jgi:hypothetical protein
LYLYWEKTQFETISPCLLVGFGHSSSHFIV